jgi:hypothetical protein
VKIIIRHMSILSMIIPININSTNLITMNMTITIKIIINDFIILPRHHHINININMMISNNIAFDINTINSNIGASISSGHRLFSLTEDFS